MPMKTTQMAAISTHSDRLESSGDSPNGSDFAFTDGAEDDDYSEPLYDDEEDDDAYDEFSGSGDGGRFHRDVQFKFMFVFESYE